ncbi:MAG: hypothetical protein QOJ22_873 [Thermoleophilaceae bacterium]|jgi:hypothetical protein|nr:hypothetical protein [Thermoleophilaceae bacterium]
MAEGLNETSAETPVETTPGVAATPDPAPIVPSRARVVHQAKTYGIRFVGIYAVLGLVCAGALTAFVVLVLKPGQEPAAAWSSWRPGSGSTATRTKDIADHVAARYRLSEGGSQLVAVLPSGPSVTSGTSTIPIKAIAIRRAPQSNAGIRIIQDTSKSRIYTLCGLGKNCSIETGTPSATRGRLVRREALEMALYTFKFVPAVESIIAFMPPPPGETTTSVLLLEKGDLKEQLDMPLAKTLSLATPPLPDAEDLGEAATIDRLTSKKVFSYELQALQTGGAALVLDPVS